MILFLIKPVITFEPFTLGGELAILFVLGMLFFLGTILVVVTLNMKNSIAKVVLGALLLSFVILAVLKESMRYAFIVLLVSWVIFVAVNVFGKVFSAFYTFIIFCIPTIILLSFLLENYPNLNQSITLFSYFAVMLVIYNISGVKINCFFMSKVLGYGPDKIEQFNYDELKNQINLIYLVAFVTLNLTILFSKQAELSQFANGINNALITGVCITNINFKSLVS